jgi:hypothetical protein
VGSVVIQYSLCRVQMMVRVNQAPVGGNCTATPQIGRSLSTIVSLRCFKWVDNEVHYPLSYSFAAVRLGSFPTTLSGVLNASSFQVIEKERRPPDSDTNYMCPNSACGEPSFGRRCYLAGRP